ncbi:putative translocase [Helianthus annuus]|nr:putative translocase [Helianthus annuus]
MIYALNQARLEANVRVKGDTNYRNKWPSPFAVACGALLLLSFLSYVFPPFKWLALGAVAIGIVPIVLKSFASLRNCRLDVNTLMLIAGKLLSGLFIAVNRIGLMCLTNALEHI